MIATLTIFCGPMPTRHVSKGLSETDLLHARWELYLDTTVKGNIDFPNTFVRQDPDKGPFADWWVDKCKAEPPMGEPIGCISNLPKELCTVEFDFRHGLYMLAHAITAPTTVTLTDGSVWMGDIIYPDVVSIYHPAKGYWLVGAVEASGTMTSQ